MIWLKELITKQEKITRDQACEELEKVIKDLPVREIHSKEELEDWE